MTNKFFLKHGFSTFLLVLLIALPLTASAFMPERTKGLSMYMLPKRVADLSGRKWGLEVSPYSEQSSLQSSSEFLTFIRKQENSIQENGVWIVTTHPDAYSESEKRLLEEIKEECRKEKIPLFIARASQLPNGWQRYDNTPR